MVEEELTRDRESDLFDIAIAATRREKVDEELVRRVEQHAIALVGDQSALRPDVEKTTVPVKTDAPPRPLLSQPIARRIVWSAALAASFLLAFVIIGRSGNRAWAEVVQAVAAQEWMRLSLQFPDDLPEDVVDPEFKIWISGDRSRFATQNLWECRWDNLAEQKTWRFDKKSGGLRLSKTEAEDRAEMQFFVQLLDRLNAQKLRRGRIRGKLIDSGRENVTIDGKQYIDFRFVFRYENSQPPVETMIVRVDDKTKRPTQLISQRDGTPYPPRVFLIDYPEIGPEDIYALDVPRDTPVEDVQSLARFFPAKKPKNVADYEMIEL